MSSIVLIIIGLTLLVVGGDFLVRSSVALSFKFSISKMVIGMTVVSFATSAPELLVSLNAALTGSPAIAINNVIGSNIANIGLVLGVTALLGAIVTDNTFYKFNLPSMLLFSVVLYYFLWNDNQLTFIEGFVLFSGLIIFLIILIKKSKKDPVDSDEVNETLANTTYFKITLWLLIGALALYFGSEWLVSGAKQLAQSLGVSDAIIAATVIAIGTSVPELSASVIAALKKEKALSLGNLIGSNIFNIASVLGLTSMIKSIPVTDTNILSKDIFWMLGFGVVLLLMIRFPKRLKIERFEGLLLLIAYCTFIVLSFVTN